jgi:hypothetical protein
LIFIAVLIFSSLRHTAQFQKRPNTPGLTLLPFAFACLAIHSVHSPPQSPLPPPPCRNYPSNHQLLPLPPLSSTLLPACPLSPSAPP